MTSSGSGVTVEVDAWAVKFDVGPWKWMSAVACHTWWDSTALIMVGLIFFRWGCFLWTTVSGWHSTPWYCPRLRWFFLKGEEWHSSVCDWGRGGEVSEDDLLYPTRIIKSSLDVLVFADSTITNHDFHGWVRCPLWAERTFVLCWSNRRYSEIGGWGTTVVVSIPVDSICVSGIGLWRNEPLRKSAYLCTSGVEKKKTLLVLYEQCLLIHGEYVVWHIKNCLFRCEQCFVKTARMQFSVFRQNTPKHCSYINEQCFSEIMYHFINYSNFCNI